MHLVYYTHGLDFRGLSTGVTVFLLVGAGYGSVRLFIDLLNLLLPLDRERDRSS